MSEPAHFFLILIVIMIIVLLVTVVVFADVRRVLLFVRKA